VKGEAVERVEELEELAGVAIAPGGSRRDRVAAHRAALLARGEEHAEHPARRAGRRHERAQAAVTRGVAPEVQATRLVGGREGEDAVADGRRSLETDRRRRSS
jgi:hypothetical protein